MTVRAYKESNLIVFMQALCLFMGFLLAGTLLPSMLYLGTGKALVLCVGLSAFLILVLPVFFRQKYDMFEPLSFVMLNTLLGVTLRSIYIIMFDNDNIRLELLMRRPREFLLGGGVIILLGLLALVAGYMMRVPKFDIMRFSLFRRNRWETGRVLWVVAVLVAIATVSTAIYVKKMGIQIIVLSDISEKHKYLLEGAQKQYTTLGYYRWGASLIQPAFFLLLAWFADSDKKWLSFTGISVFLVGILSTAFPFLNSSKSDVVLVLINAIVIWHYTRRAISIRKVVWAIVAVVLMIVIMTGLRKDANEIDDLMPYLTGEKILQTVVGNRNLLGIGKTSYIIDHVPGKLEYQLGKTFILWLVAPIPRTMWTGKPVISVGEVIGKTIYSDDPEAGGGGAGIPPGFVVELFWNFGILGVPIGMFLLGWWLNLMYRSFKSQLSSNKNAVLMYVSLVVPFAFIMLGSNFSGVVIGLITSLITMVFALLFIGRY